MRVPENAPPTTIRVMRYDAERFEERAVEVADLQPPPRDGRVTWIDVQGFGNGDALASIRDAFGIHPLAMDDVVHVPQRPKADAYRDHHLVVTQMARITDEPRIVLEQVTLILGIGWVITVQERPGDVFDPIRDRLRQGAGVIRRMGADFLAYALLDAVVDGYFPVLEELGEVLEELEEEVITRPQRTTLARIHGVRRLLLHTNRVQRRQRDMVAELLRSEGEPFTDGVRVYLRDVHDHAIQVTDLIETYREMSVGLLDIYLSALNNRMNEVMKTLTIMASIFIPLTFVVGLYGMNFEHMPELSWRWGYPAVWTVMLAIVLFLLWTFRRRGWLDREDLRDGAAAASGEPTPGLSLGRSAETEEDGAGTAVARPETRR